MTFLISLVIFGLIAFLVVGLVLDSLGLSSVFNGDEGGPADEYVEGPVNSSGDDLDGNSFNMLFVGLDYVPHLFYNYYDPSTVAGLLPYDLGNLAGQLVTDGEYRKISADTILLVCVSKERKEFAFSSINPGTLIDKNGETSRLSDIFESEGFDGFIETVETLTGVTVDRYALAGIEEFPDVINAIGGVDFTVPCDMVYDDFKGALHINITAGYQHLDGETALDMLRFDSYTDVVNSRLRTTVSFAKAFMRKMTDPKYMTKAAALFKEIGDMVITNLTVADLTANLDLIFSYPNFEAVSIELPGTYSVIDGEKCFLPNKAGCINAFAAYKRLK